MSATTHSTVQLSDGAKLQVWLLGGDDASKPLIITLHGAPGLSTHSEPEASFGFLATTYRVLVYDARGSGDSDLTGPLTNERWIADIDELREWAGESAVILAGGSYGGFLALDYVLAHPTRVSALILRDTFAYGLRGMMRTLATIITSPRIRPDAAQQVRLWSGNLLDEHDFKTAVDDIMPIYKPETANGPDQEETKFEGTPREYYHFASQNAAFSHNVPRFDVRNRLGEIKAPTLIVVGRQDPITPVEDSEELHNGIAGSQLAVFEKSGHSPPSDEPEAFREVVWKFLNKLDK